MFRKFTFSLGLAALALMFVTVDAVAGTGLVTHLMANPEGLLMAPVAAAALPETIKAELERIRSECVQPLSDTSARLASLEQAFAKSELEGSLSGTYPQDSSVGARAVEEMMHEDHGDFAFKAAYEAASRNMKPSQFSARVNLESGIKAALTNDGRGGANDTSVPSSPERRGFVGPVQRPLRLLDALPSRPTSNDSVEFIQISATGDADYQLLEGDEKSEIAVEGTALIANIATIAGWTSASKQVLADHAALQQQVDRVIRHKVLSRLEHQILNGAGGVGQINGLLNQATEFTPSIGATPADRVGEVLMRMANVGYQPNLVVMNPLDWYRLQITRNNDEEQEYLFGSPTQPLPPSLWNTRIVSTPSMPEGTGLTIDTGFVTVLDREQMTVMVSNSHADFFVRNLVAILGELRAGLEVLDVNAVRKFDLVAPAAP